MYKVDRIWVAPKDIDWAKRILILWEEDDARPPDREMLERAS